MLSRNSQYDTCSGSPVSVTTRYGWCGLLSCRQRRRRRGSGRVRECRDCENGREREVAVCGRVMMRDW